MNTISNNLYNSILQYQKGDKDSFTIIYEKFMPLVKKYARKLEYDGADSDMAVALLEIVGKLPVTENMRFSNEALIVGYIDTAMKNRYISYSKNSRLINEHEQFLNTDLNYDHYIPSWDDKIFIETLLNKLSKKEKQVLQLKYIKDYSDAEIAESLHISRQAVNKTKNRALKNIRTNLLN